MNLINFIKNKYKSWKAERELNKEIDRTVMRVNDLFLQAKEEQNAVKSMYQEGLNRVAKKVNRVVDTKNVENVISLAEDDDINKKKQLDSLKEIFIYKQEKPKNDMIEDRISQYYELQNHIIKRKELRKRRKDLNGN